MTAPRLLLINPWIYDFSAYDLWSKPIGLLYIASYLRNSGYKVDFMDCMDRHFSSPFQTEKTDAAKVKKFGTGPFHKEKVEKPESLEYVPRYFYRYGIPEEWFRAKINTGPKPEAVLLTSLMTYWYPGIKHAVEIIREIWPDVPVILGGIYATLMPDHARSEINPDYLICGPGEAQIRTVLEKLFPSFQPPEFGKINETGLDPALDLYKKLDYLILMTSYGCPYKCTFCATDKISGRFRERTAESVFEELKRQLHHYHVHDVAFYDDALLINKKNRIIPFLKMVIGSKLNLRFHTPNGLHASEIDPELATVFYQSGFRTIRLSFESVNPERLSDMKNKVTPNDLANAVSNLEQAGYARSELDAYVLMGLPNQEFSEIYQSIFFVHSLGIKIRLASFSPIPGTVDYQRTIDAGLFPADADPVLMNNSIYPLHRNEASYYQYHHIRQLVHVLNDAANRSVNLLKNPEIVDAFQRIASLKSELC